MHELFDAVPTMVPGLAAMACVVLASGFFSACEAALFHVSHDELRTMRSGTSRERLAARLLGEPHRVLTGILFWRLTLNLIFLAVGTAIARELVRADRIAAAVGFCVGSLVTLLALGEALPKGIDTGQGRRLSSLLSVPLALALRAIDPLMPRLERTARIVRHAFWPHVEREPLTEMESLERAVTAWRQTEDAVQLERQALQNVLRLSELTVEELMRPRGTYVTLAAPIMLADLRGQAPPGDIITVQDGSSDDISGAIPLAGLSAAPEGRLDSAAEEAAYVPWCATAAAALELLRERSCRVASVVNEYGESIGIVIYEDLLDTVLTRDPSRTRRVFHREPVTPAADGEWDVDGFSTLRYLCRKLGMDYDPDGDPVVTVRGLFFDELERIPEAGDAIAWRGFRLVVTDVSRRGEVRVRISREAAR